MANKKKTAPAPVSYDQILAHLSTKGERGDPNKLMAKHILAMAKGGVVDPGPAAEEDNAPAPDAEAPAAAPDAEAAPAPPVADDDPGANVVAASEDPAQFKDAPVPATHPGILGTIVNAVVGAPVVGATPAGGPRMTPSSPSSGGVDLSNPDAVAAAVFKYGKAAVADLLGQHGGGEAAPQAEAGLQGVRPPLAAVAPGKVTPMVSTASVLAGGKGGGGGGGGSGAYATGGLEKLQQNLTGAATAEAQNQKDLAHSLAIAAGAEGSSLQQQQVAGQAVQQHFQTQFQDAMDRSLKELQAANAPIDPNHYWASRSTFGKVLAGIGLFVGGLNSNGNPQPNPIMQAINQDIEIQKNAAERHLAVGKQFQDRANMFQQAGMNALQAQDAAVKLTQAIYAQKTVELTQQHAGPTIALQLAQSLAKNGIDFATVKADLATKAQDATLKGIQITSQRMALQQQAALNAANINLYTKGASFHDLPADQQMAFVNSARQEGRFVPGSGVTNLKLLPEEQQQLSAINAVAQHQQALDSIAQKPLASWSPDDRKEAQGHAAAIKELYTGAVGGKETPETTRNKEILDGVVKDPTAIFQTGYDGSRQSLLSGLDIARSNLGGGLMVDMRAPAIKTIPRKK